MTDTYPNKPLTIVITGASSGIGQATAEAFAREGARLVLAARDLDAVEDVSIRCRKRGAEAISVKADVTDTASVNRLVQAAVDFGGTVDVWVSNVGTGAVGAFQDTPWDAHEQVVRTNLLGHMAEAHAIVPHFLTRKRGTFINMLSLGGFAGTPYAAAYSASKFGLKGFAEALRGELSKFPDIHICDVYPTFVDTPGLSHGANYTGRELSAPPPVFDASKVADAVVALVQKPRNTTIIGWPSYALRFAHALSPALTGAGMARFIEFALRLAKPAAPTDGNLYRPPRVAGGVSGGLKTVNKPAAIALIGVSLAAAAGVMLAVIRSNRKAYNLRR